MPPIRVVGDPQNYEDCEFTKFASSVSPIDEAKLFPILHKEITNQMDHGLCRTILARPDMQHQVVRYANQIFMQHERSGTDCMQTEMRGDMHDHLCYQLRDAHFETPEPENKFERWAEKVMDWFFPDRIERREMQTASLEVEKMLAKYAFGRMAVFTGMLRVVMEETSDKKNVA